MMTEKQEQEKQSYSCAVLDPIADHNPSHRAPFGLQAKEWEKQQRRLAALKKGGQSKGKAEETVRLTAVV